MVYNAYFEIPIIDIPKTVSSLRLHPHLPGRQSENEGVRSPKESFALVRTVGPME